MAQSSTGQIPAAWFISDAMSPPPADPGGDFTPKRIATLRACALAYPQSTPFAFSPNHSQPLLNALEEIEALHVKAAAREADMVLIARIMSGIEWGWIQVMMGPPNTWPPTWLVEMVENGTADERQAERAKVAEEMGAIRRVAEERLEHEAERTTRALRPAVAAHVAPRASVPWYRHAEPPRGFDPAALASARRVLALCKGRA